MPDVTDPKDPAVIAALQVRCGLGSCGALPGKRCQFKGRPLMSGAIVHMYRVEFS